MSKEASKFKERWEKEGLFARYFTGRKVLDIGCGEGEMLDKIVPDADPWDRKQGDGQKLEGIPDETYDVVFSSHFIEHVHEPLEGLLNQWRVLKPLGHLIFLVPDEDLYEQGIWPSMFNDDHKYSYTIGKSRSWSSGTRNLVDLIKFLPDHKIVSMRIVDTGYNYATDKAVDQTHVLGAEAAIEVIVQKNPPCPEMLSTLPEIFVCPACHRSEFVIRGIRKDRDLDVWCHSCGASGHLRPNQYVKTVEKDGKPPVESESEDK